MILLSLIRIHDHNILESLKDHEQFIILTVVMYVVFKDIMIYDFSETKYKYTAVQ
jgi:hypothetical protein